MPTNQISLNIRQGGYPVVLYPLDIKGNPVSDLKKVSMLCLEDLGRASAVQINYRGPLKILSLSKLESLRNPKYSGLKKSVDKIGESHNPNTIEVDENGYPLIGFKRNRNNEPLLYNDFSLLSFGRRFSPQLEGNPPRLRVNYCGNIYLAEYDSIDFLPKKTAEAIRNEFFRMNHELTQREKDNAEAKKNARYELRRAA
jgi:hypothetical protein